MAQNHKYGKIDSINNKEDNISKEFITPNMYKVADTNCHTLLAKENISQHQLALATGFADAAVSNYINCNATHHFPSINFLVALQKNYGISIDEFISKELPPSQITPDIGHSAFESNERMAYKTYCGAYYCHYFDTSKYKGRDYNSDEESLLYGIIFIYRDLTAKDTLSHSCIAILGFKTAESVRTAMNDLSGKFDETNISEFGKYIDANESYCYNTYYGDFELSSTSAFLSLSHKDKDRALIILHRVPSNSHVYSGGIGTINSVSRGREPMPTVQFIGLSREFLNFPAEEIHHILQLKYPSFKARESAKTLLRKFKNLYLVSDSPYKDYSDFDKELVITGNIDAVLKDLLKKNLFRYGKISNRDDDEWYHFIKDATDYLNDIEENNFTVEN